MMNNTKQEETKGNEKEKKFFEDLDVHNHWIWSSSNILFVKGEDSSAFKKVVEGISKYSLAKTFNNFYFLDNFSPIHRTKFTNDPTFSILDVILRT